MNYPPPESWQISPEGRAWHTAFADAVASRDPDRYVSFMHENCSVQINNAMPVYSKLAIGAAFKEYVKAFCGLQYELLNAFGTDQQSLAEALFTYTLNDGSTEIVQHAYIVGRDADGLLTSVRVFGDVTRILKPFMPAND